MSTVSLLRGLVILSWILISALIYGVMVLDQYLPIELQQWQAIDEALPMAQWEWVPLLLAFVYLIAHIVASVGLLLLKAWGAWLYLSSVVLGVLIAPFFGPTVEHAFMTTLSEMLAILDGLIIGVAFFSVAIFLPNDADYE